MAEVLNDTIEWIEVPTSKGGRGAGRPNQRKSMATYRRQSGTGYSEEIQLATSLLEGIGSPSCVELAVDARLGRLAFRASDSGRNVTRSKRDVTNARVSVGGLANALGFPRNPDPVRLRAAIVNGMILMEPIKPPVPCAHCNGSGVQK